jgi:membrane protein DedA with SNARE-associated domain
MKKMSHKIELITLVIAGFASQFATDLLEKVIITTLAMVIGTTFAYYWKRYLEHKDKNKED